MKTLIAFMVGLSLIVSCSKEKPCSPKNRINLSFIMDPPAFDPRKTGTPVDSTMSFMLFSGLSTVLPNGKIGPGIAKTFELSDDQKTYTFYLRDAKWSDGHPITAYDFEKSWKDIIDPTFPSITTKLFYCIKNAEKAANGKLSIDEVKVKALNEKILQVELEYPAPYFINLTAFCAFFPAPSHIVKANSNWDSNPSSTFVSSGPFKLVHWKPKNEILVTKNPNYWNEKEVKIDEITVHIIEDSNTALQMFEEKKLDFLGTPVSPLPIAAESALHKWKEFKKFPIAGFTFFAFNVERFPFNNLSMRKAFSYAIDRQDIVKGVTFNNQKPAKGIIPPPFESNEDDYLLPNNDPQKARLLFQQGLKELNANIDDIKITLQVPTNSIEKKIAEAVQTQINDVLGIRIILLEKEKHSHMSSVRAHEHQIAIAAFIFQYKDLMNFFERFRNKDDSINYCLWNSPKFIDLLNQANKTIDSSKRYEIFKDLEKLFIEELPMAHICYSNFLTIQQQDFQDIVVGEVGDLHFEYASKGRL